MYSIMGLRNSGYYTEKSLSGSFAFSVTSALILNFVLIMPKN